MTDEAAVRAAINSVLDPCSAAAGAPAGIVDMGLVTEVTVAPVDHGVRVGVRLRLTDPTCVMGPVFMESAHAAVEALPGVSAVEIAYDEDSTGWTSEDMSPAYRRRLTVLRRERAGVGPVAPADA